MNAFKPALQGLRLAGTQQRGGLLTVRKHCGSGWLWHARLPDDAALAASANFSAQGLRVDRMAALVAARPPKTSGIFDAAAKVSR